MRRTIVIATVVAVILGGGVQPALATHFDGDPATGSFNPILTVTSTASQVNAPSTVTLKLTQEDHEDPVALLWLRSPGDWQYAFDALRPGEPAAGWPTGNTGQRCESTMDGLYDSPDGTGTPGNTDTSKRHNATIARAERIGTILLRAHVDGVSRPGSPITWNGHIAFHSYDAVAEVADLCLLLVTNDSRVMAIADPVPGCGGAAPRRRCDDVEGISEIVAAFTASRVTLPDSRVVWETTGDLTGLVKEQTVVQNLNGSALELTSVLFGTSAGNWNTGGAVTFSRSSLESGTKVFEGVFQTCPETPDSSWGNCKSNKGDRGDPPDPTVGGIVVRQVPIPLSIPAPAISSPTANQRVTTASVPFAGTTEPGKIVTVSAGTTVVAVSDPASSTGAWSAVASPSLAEGSYTVTAVASDTGGASPASGARSFLVDVAPAPPTISAPAPDAVLGAGTVTVTGTAQGAGGNSWNPAATIKVYDETDQLLGQTTASASGAFSVPITLTDKRTHTIAVTATDLGGASLPSLRSFRITTAVPVITTPGPDAHLNNAGVVVQGSAEPGATVALDLDGTALAPAVAGPDGTFTADLGTLAEATYTLTAAATSVLDGETSPELVRIFTVDLTAPDAPQIVSPADGAALNSLNVTFSGTAEPHATVVISTADGELTRTTAGAGGAWSTLKRVADGEHTITAVAIDRAGNTSVATDPVTFTAEDALKVLSPTEGSAQPGAVVVRGTAEVNADRVFLYLDGTQVLSKAIAGGTWTATLQLTSGQYSLTAATSTGGTLTPQTEPVTFTVDATPPILMSSGVGTAGRAFLLPGESINGTARDNGEFDSGVASIEVVYFSSTGRMVGRETADCTGCTGGEVSWIAYAADLKSGELYRAHIVAIDAVGNRSVSRDVTFLRL